MKTNRRRLLIVLVVVAAILLMALTAAGVYAIVLGSGLPDLLLNRLSEPAEPPALAQEPDEDEPANIYDQGVLVKQVDPGGAAAAAGIRRGSIILSVDGVGTNTAQALIDELEQKGGRAVVVLSVLNGADPEDVSLTLADEAPYLGVELVSDAGHFRTSDGENCVCDFDFQLPEDLDQFRHLPEEFDFDGSQRFFGVFVQEVVEDSAAAAAGLQVGDRIEAFDGRTVESVDQLVDLIGAKSPGDTVTLSVARGDESLELTASLGANPEDDSRAFLGVSLGSRAGIMRGQPWEMFPIIPDGEMMGSGAVVVEVVADSAAAEAGLQKGDLIQAIDGETVDSVDALVELVGEQAPGDEVIVTILREGESQEIAVTLGAHPDHEEQAYMGVEIGAFFNFHVERSEDGDEAAPGEFFFHMQPGDELDEFFGDHFRERFPFEIPEYDA